MTARPAHYLHDMEIEEIVMRSPQGQKALGLGIGSAFLDLAIRDLGKVKTRRRLDDWLQALGEPWYRQRMIDRERLQADTKAMEAEGVHSDLAAAGLSLMKSRDRKEAQLLETYGQREMADA